MVRPVIQPRAHAGSRLSRRETLRPGVLGWVVAPLCGLWPARVARAARGGFLTAGQRATLAAAVDRMIPPDEDPGGADLGAVDYVDGLLGAFLDVDAGRARAPRIFGGGPFSGRHGGAPRFARFVQLTRVQEI